MEKANITPGDIGLDDTDDLPEGSVNLYYTDARVETYVSGAGYFKGIPSTWLESGDNDQRASQRRWLYHQRWLLVKGKIVINQGCIKKCAIHCQSEW